MIISIIENLVNQLNVNGVTFGFGHGASYWANLLNDEFDFGDFKAIIYLDQPITTEYQLTAGGYIGEFYLCLNPNWNGYQPNTIQNVSNQQITQLDNSFRFAKVERI